jgi:diguanylate cyclase (GGDEF)-like protein
VVKGSDGETLNRIYAAQNITERRRAEKRIRYLARIDALTKVPNRMQFQHLLQRSIARARRGGYPLCLFYVDVDHFKEINDTFGHLAGDTTLETVAERLGAALPKNSIIGRLAGDEFAVMVDKLGPGASGMRSTEKLARKILDRLADPFFVQGHEVFMTASMGIAFYPKDAANVIDLIRNADAALYHAKKNGGNDYSFYKPQMNEATVDRLMTKSKLKRSFERDELLVHYQPKYNLETGEVFGAEALVRWELPERGLILPSDFIPIAEETSLIIEIGEWVLDKVCEDFRLWQQSVSSPGRVSVNLSLKQLRQLNFINRISAILRGHEVSPTSLELEITETTLMENPTRTIKLLDQLYGLGLHLAIDDFGTGYSSLSALQQFPISTLKIDQSFVRDIATSPDDATIVDTIIQMGRNLNMDVVAEGVENEAQLAFLQEHGCTYAQGLLFGDPMSSENYLELLLAQADGTDSFRALFA